MHAIATYIILTCDNGWLQLMNNVDKFLDRLKTFKPLIDDNKIPKKSFDATRSYLELPHFNRSVPPDTLQSAFACT